MIIFFKTFATTFLFFSQFTTGCAYNFHCNFFVVVLCGFSWLLLLLFDGSLLLLYDDIQSGGREKIIILYLCWTWIRIKKDLARNNNHNIIYASEQIETAPQPNVRTNTFCMIFTWGSGLGIIGDSSFVDSRSGHKRSFSVLIFTQWEEN